MGLAKYYEDNYNLWSNRLFPMSKRKCESEVIFPRSTQYIPSWLITSIEQEELEMPIRYEDRHIMCRTCGKKFLFSARSQKFFDSKGWEDPRRCKHCREARKMQFLMCASF